MRRSAVLGVLAVCLWLGGPLDAGAVISEEEFEAMKKRLGIVEKELADKKKHEAEEGATKAKKEGEKSPVYTFESSTGGGKSVYAKPFVSAPKTTVGGYMDFQYRMFNKNTAGNGVSNTFDQTRFVPFFYSDITDRLKVAAELEIEHGIREKSLNEDAGGIEISLEFAHLDYLINEKLNFRGGILLLPVGKFNLLHDSPLNDLNDRPLVAQRIIPTTLSETGAGFYGTFYPTRLSKLDYELYVTQGFNGYKNDGTPVIGSDAGLKDARQRVGSNDDGLDNNNGKAVVGRVAFSPILGIEVGGSGYYGTYDPASKRPLSIVAVDWTFQRGPFELIGEAAWVHARHNNQLLDGMPAIDPDTGRSRPTAMDGYYVQANYHFLPQFLRRAAPTFFTDASTFTAVVRWDQINTDSQISETSRERLTFGLNFRPVEDTVFRVDYQFNFEDGKNNRISNDGLVLSLATYF